MNEFFGKIFGGNKNEENEYNREAYKKAEESLEFADKIVNKGIRMNNDIVSNTPHVYNEKLSVKRGQEPFFANKEVDETLDILQESYSNMIHNMEKRYDEVKKDFEKLKEKGEKEAYALNKEYDALLSKFSAKMKDEIQKHLFFKLHGAEHTIDFESKEKNAVKKFEQEKLGMKDENEE